MLPTTGGGHDAGRLVPPPAPLRHGACLARLARAFLGLSTLARKYCVRVQRGVLVCVCVISYDPGNLVYPVLTQRLN